MNKNIQKTESPLIKNDDEMKMVYCTKSSRMWGMYSKNKKYS